MTNCEPFHCTVVPASAAPMMEATPFRLVAVEKSRPVAVFSTPSTLSLKPPALTAVQTDICFSAADSTAPRRVAEVAALAQRPM